MITITPSVLLFPLKMAGIINEVALPITLRKQIIFATKWVIKALKTKYRVLNLRSLCILFLLSVRDDGLAFNKKKQVQIEAVRNRYLVKYFK